MEASPAKQSPPEPQPSRGRYTFVLAGVVALFAVMALRLVSAQTADDRGVNTFTRTLKANRGGIYDRHGRSHPLAESYPLWKVFVDPVAIPDDAARADVYRALRPFGICPDETLYEAVAAPRGRYHVLGLTADRAVADAIATNPVLAHRVGAESQTRRNYPLGRELCHVVGVVNSHEEPLCGLEQTMDEHLRGTDGSVTGSASGVGRELGDRPRTVTPPVDGRDVILTVDEQVQFAVDEALDWAMEEFHPISAWAIVQHPSTGEILAMSSRPDFDPADYGSSNPTSRWNSAVFKAYEPGSVMKSAAAAAALQERLVSTNTLLDCSRGLYCGRPLEDHVNGTITLTEVIQKSSNRGASRLGMLLGKDRQRHYLKEFGFGARTGIGLQGESVGYLGGRWSDLQNIRVSIGQGVSVTAIQLVTFYSCIANGGRLMRPRIVREIRNPDGTVFRSFPPEVVRTPLRPEVAADMRFMLETVVGPGGTAKRARIPGYRVAGKTGTAQKAEHGVYSRTRFCGTFVGFFPADDPKLTILVTLEEPHPNYHGGTVAAPVFARIGAEAARILRIPPEEE